MTETMTLDELRALIAQTGSGLWSGRCGDDPDSHLTAWAWIERPDAVETYGDAVEVRHPDHTGGRWVTIVEDVLA
jgi:hypothetical protein